MSSIARTLTAVATIALVATLPPAPAGAQFGGLADRIRKKAAEKAEKQVEQRAEQATDRAIAGG
jgi:hypothetical protein